VPAESVKSSFTIWCNHDFAPWSNAGRDLLTSGIGDHRLLLFEPDQDGKHGASRAALQTADIAFGYPDARAIVACEQLLWVQLQYAGYTSFDSADIKQSLTQRGTILTNSSDVFDEPCAQHVLAMMMALARGLPAALDSQRSDHAWPRDATRSQLRLLNGQTVLLLGFGAIARRLVELLHPFEMDLIAVRRKLTGDEPIRMAQTSDVDQLLPHADHVVNILPANEETKNFLNAARLASLKPGAIVYNIGRGTTLDQNALITELKSGHIAAAYLDVTDPEPLTPEHPLWSTPNCYVTPHTAGGQAQEKEDQVRHFLDNLRCFEQGEALHNRVW
jgi:phosphoglycerate dehydrogenase-like enzyme